MKKTVLIVCLSAITTFGFSQTKTPAKPAPKASNNAAQPAATKPSGVSAASEKIATPASEGQGAPTVNPIEKSKVIAIDLFTAIVKSSNRAIDKDALNAAIATIGSSTNKDDLFNAVRMIVESAPGEAYKTGNLEAGRQISGNFNSDLELDGFNSIIMKWESLVKPECFEDAWKTNEVKWKKQIQGTK